VDAVINLFNGQVTQDESLNVLETQVLTMRGCGRVES